MTDAPSNEEAASAVCETAPDAPSCAVGGDRAYSHPLQNIRRLPDGTLPFFDTRLSPAGKVYAIADGLADDGKQKVRTFGIVELERRSIPEAERHAKGTRPDRTKRPSTIDPMLREVLDGQRPAPGAPNEALGVAAEGHDSPQRAGLAPIKVEIHLERVLSGTITTRINRAIAEGHVQTFADRYAVRAAEMEKLAELVSARVDPIAAFVREAGGEVIYTCRYSPCLSAVLDPALIERLATVDGVRRIRFYENSSVDELHGGEKSEVYQTRPFWDETFHLSPNTYDYSGNNGLAITIRSAVLDDTGFRPSHRAFREASGSVDRIDGMWDCRNGPCASVTSFASPGSHGTPVLGTLLGDYRDGQDSGVTTVAERERRSAPAGESQAYLFHASREESDQQAVYDTVVGIPFAPHLLVSSNSIGGNHDCSGEHGTALGADGVYEAGIAYFKSVNQNKGGSADDCSVGHPAEAIGVFAIGGFDDNAADADNDTASDTDSICASRDAGVHPDVNWGGSTTTYDEGKHRSILALTGSYQGSYVPTSASDTSVGDFAGTSHATPSVASAAIDFIDMMKNLVHSNSIDDPGILYAWMLNMGDRRDQNGNFMTAGYDHRTGAGNVKMRFLGDAGLDAPSSFASYELCVEQNEQIRIRLNNGNPFSTDHDSLRVTAWWYDRRIEDGVSIDDIDLVVTDGVETSASVSAHDNKERAFLPDVGGRSVEIRVSGYSVTSDLEGCGNNSMRVFVTYILEDNDRDDADGPGYDAQCRGAERL